MTSPARRFDIATLPEAEAALEHFNAFHDGFMKRIHIVSRDEMLEDSAQTCTALFDVEIDFAHTNYEANGRPLQPHTQRVRAAFEGVQDLHLELRREYLGNTITALRFADARRRLVATDAEEACLVLDLARQAHLEPERRWETRWMRLLDFRRATIHAL